jgi:AAA family ATP:ADP antiporter
VGIFSLTTIAQFWSYANEIYTRAEGDRLFPLIAIGSTAGAPLGAAVAGWLFERGMSPFLLMEIAAGILLLHLSLYRVVARRMAKAADRPMIEPIKAGNGFGLILKSRYLKLVALFLVLLNLVNTLGEFILGQAAVASADQSLLRDPAFDKQAYLGAFYGRYFLMTNIAAILIQAFLVSRIVKRFDMKGVLLALPIVSFLAYGSAALGAGLATLLYVKIAENSTDYSITNTAKQMLWLPTSREEKYKAKQAIDTFFVRFGDMLAAGLVFVGTRLLSRGVESFARVNMLIVAAAIVVGVLLLREHAGLIAIERETAG